MDPFVLLEQFANQGKIKVAIANKVRARGRSLEAAVERVERASGLRFPPYYVDPALPVAITSAEFGSVGALFARVIPATFEGGISIIVQFAAPLLLYGTKSTVEAVAAHEFTHYVDLVRRLSRMEVLSDERASTLYEAGYADEERTVDPVSIFQGDRKLAMLVKRKFTPNLTDEKLDRRVGEEWVEKGLPTRRVAPEENNVRLDAEAVARARFDPMVVDRVRSLEAKSPKVDSGIKNKNKAKTQRNSAGRAGPPTKVRN